MADNYRHILVVRHGSIACVHLVKPRLDENEIYELWQELIHLGCDGGCPRIALSLGPRTPDCLYSVFLAKLISLQRRLRELGGGLKLCECTDQVLEILDACLLLEWFDIVPTPADALAQWGIPTGPALNGPPRQKQGEAGQ